MTTVWNFPTRIAFGAGEAANTGRSAITLGLKRPLVVTDAGVQKAGLVDRIARSLSAAGLEHATFANIESNPTEANVRDAAEAYSAHGADGVIAVGGGSPLDVAKLVAVRARTERPWEELDDAKGGDRFIPADLPPVIALPTTAGTGSEVGRSAVLTVESSGRKTVVFHPSMMPRLAILDPELTISMPPLTTAATGFDALTHCVEAYLAKGDHPMADAIAIQGVDLVSSNLPRVLADGANVDARGNMMKAAMMGAVAFQKGLGACHSLAHPLSSEHGLHHGLANAMCLPAVIGFNEKQVADRVMHIGVLLGAEPALGACAKRIAAFREAIGLPGGLRENGVEDSHLDALADAAFADACHHQNPRECTRDDLRALYAESM